VYKLKWRPKFTNFGHTKKSQVMEHKPIPQMGSDRMPLRYTFHKSFTVKFLDKCVQQNRFNPDHKRDLIWYTNGSNTNKGTGAGMYIRGRPSVLGSTPWYSRLK
jgi:hypothetical protein